jgi:type II secretory pathway component PulF
LKSLLEAGAPIKEALGSLARRAGRESLAARLLRALEADRSLGEALEEAGQRVPAAHIAMVTAGERSGKLVEALEMVLGEIEARRESRKALLVRMGYPFALLALAAILFPIPLILTGRTWAYIGIQLAVFVPLILLALLVSRGPGLFPPGTPARRRLERFLLGVPILRRAILDLVLGRVLRLLGMLLDAGLGYGESLPLAGEAAGWDAVRQGMRRIDRELRRGSTAYESFAALPGLSESARARIDRGEREGMVGSAFLEVGNELQERFRLRLRVTLYVLFVVGLFAVGLVVLYQGLRVLGGLAS